MEKVDIIHVFLVFTLFVPPSFSQDTKCSSAASISTSPPGEKSQFANDTNAQNGHGVNRKSPNNHAKPA